MSGLRYHTNGNRHPFRQGYRYQSSNAGRFPVERKSLWARILGKVGR